MSSKISALVALAASYAGGDLLPIVDVSDTTQAASGSTKYTTVADLLKALPGNTNAVSLGITGHSLTGANAQSLIDVSGTWNTSGTPTLIKGYVTDTASNAASLLLDLGVGSTSQIKCTKAGLLTITGNFVTPGTAQAGAFNATGSVYGGNYAWALESDGSYLLANRYGTNACTFRNYRTFTNSTNYQRLSSMWNVSTALVHNEGLGTGADGSVAFNDAALATNATRGFVMLPSCAGTPTGVPADIPTGQAPMVVDSTNFKLYMYVGGAWKGSAAFS